MKPSEPQDQVVVDFTVRFTEGSGWHYKKLQAVFAVCGDGIQENAEWQFRKKLQCAIRLARGQGHMGEGPYEVGESPMGAPALQRIKEAHEDTLSHDGYTDVGLAARDDDGTISGYTHWAHR